MKKNIDELQNTKTMLSELVSEVKEIKDELNEVNRLLKYSVDKQYYYHAFFNPELLKLQTLTDNGILLCGNYGNPNMGDEWMLDTILEYIRRYSTKEITIMLEPNRIFDPSIYLKYNVNYIHYPQTIYDYDFIVDKFDILIFGGGAIIEDRVYYEAYDFGVNICRTVVDMPLRFIAKNKKVFFIGLSASTKINNIDYIKKLNTVINKANFFSVRDAYSLNVLKQTGICTNKIKLIHDIVYANAQLAHAVERFKTGIYESDLDIVRIGIVYIVAEETKSTFFALLNNIKKELNSNGKKCEITVIPFYDSWHIDYDFYVEAAKTEEYIEVIPYNSDIEFIIDTFEKQDLMICARYHAILLSFCLGIPCVGLYYDTHQHYYNKISYLFEQFGYHLDNCIPLSMLATMTGSILKKAVCVEKECVEEIIKEAQDDLNTLLEKTM